MNEACCSRPLVSHTYEPVGKYETLKDGMNIYSVGPESAERGIVFLYDVFGYTQQLLLGADTLAATLPARVYVPDFFRGQGPDPKIFPADTDEKKALAQKFLDGVGSFSATAAGLPALRQHLENKEPSVKKWASLGFCWGGKVVAVSSQKDSPWDASGACHPGLIQPEEASAFTIPHICLLSAEDGSEQERQVYNKALDGNGHNTHFEIFDDQVHGWMAGRADLQNKRVKEEFERGYFTVSTFFQKNL